MLHSLFYSWGFSTNLLSLLLTLLIVSGAVYLYGNYYISGTGHYTFFLVLYLVFVVSMMLLITSHSGILAIAGWDLLGLSSFLLILYYGSASSALGGLSTSLVIRLGDLAILYSISFLSETLIYVALTTIMVLWLTVAVITKSAQLPFLGWLVRAISAPTPVSALVHSSTLVVAGLVLLYLLGSTVVNVSPYLSLVGVLTLLIAGLLSLVEVDIKKIVALSTLSQISLCVISMSVGASVVTYIHLLAHSYVKSVLFLSLGHILYSLVGQQDRRAVFTLSTSSYSMIVLTISLSSLCGLLYSSASYSKELLLSTLFYIGSSSLYSLLFLLGVFFTLLYSYRLWLSVVSYRGSWGFSTSATMQVVFSTLILVIVVLSFTSLTSNYYVAAPTFTGLSSLWCFFLLSLLLVSSGVVAYSEYTFSMLWDRLFEILFRALTTSSATEVLFIKVLFDTHLYIWCISSYLTVVINDALPAITLIILCLLFI